jgi:anti-anti-sigma regulatory factor
MMLSSAGIRVIVQTAERRETKGRVRAAGLDPQIGQVLKLVRIDSIVPVHPTVEAAIAACLAAGA